MLLLKQISTYFEDKQDNMRLQGLEMLAMCTTDIHHPTAPLLKHLYDTLLVSLLYKILMTHYLLVHYKASVIILLKCFAPD